MFGWGISERYKRDYHRTFSTPCLFSECSDVAHIPQQHADNFTAFFTWRDDSTQTEGGDYHMGTGNTTERGARGRDLRNSQQIAIGGGRKTLRGERIR